MKSWMLVFALLSGCPATTSWTDDEGWRWQDPTEEPAPGGSVVRALLSRGNGANSIRDRAFRSPGGDYAPFPRRRAATGRFRDDYFVFYDNERQDWYVGDRVGGNVTRIDCPRQPARPMAEDDPSDLYWTTADTSKGFVPDALAIVCEFGSKVYGGRGRLVFQLRASSEFDSVRLQWVKGADGAPLALWQEPDGAWSSDISRYLSERDAERLSRDAARAEHERKLAEEKRRADETAARDPLNWPIEVGTYCVIWGFYPDDSSLPYFLMADLKVTRSASQRQMRKLIEDQMWRATKPFGTSSPDSVIRLAKPKVPRGEVAPPFDAAAWYQAGCDGPRVEPLPANLGHHRVTMSYP